MELANFIDKLNELVWLKYKRENNFSPKVVIWAARVTKGHLKAKRIKEADALKELI